MKQITLLFLFLPLVCFAEFTPQEEAKIDSLKQVIEQAVHDTTMYSAQLEWANIISSTDWEAAINMTNKVEAACQASLEDSPTNTNEKGYLVYLDKATYLKGIIYNENGKFDTSIEHFKRSLQLAEQLKNEKDQIKYLNNLGNRYSMSGDYEMAWEYYKQTLARSQKFDNKEAIINAIISISEASARSNQMDTSVAYIEKGLALSEEIGYEYGKARSFHNMGINYHVEGDLAKAAEYYYKGLRIYETLGMKQKIGASLFSLSYVHMFQEEYDKALEIIERKTKISEEVGDKIGMMKSLNLHGRVHYLKDDEPKALTYYKKSLELAKKLGHKHMMGVNYELMGDIYLNQFEVAHKLDTALLYYQKALSIFKKTKDNHMISSTLLEIGKVYDYRGDTQNGIKTITKAYNLAKETDAIEPQWFTARKLYELYKETGDTKRALEMHEIAIVMRDSMQKEEARQENIRQSVQYEYDRKAIQDSLQNIQQQQLMQSQLNVQRQRFNMLGFGLLLAGLLISGLIYFYRQLGKAKQKTENQAQLISKTNQKLSVSLEHQKMLQSEIHHRVKNNLQVIISLLELQKEDIVDEQAQQSLDAMSSRIFSMSAIHEILYQKEGVARVRFSDYTENLCRHFGDFSRLDDRPIFDLDIKGFEFNLETSMPLGIILTELITNSLKYARKEDQRLHISISMEKLDKWTSLIYRDNGPGFPTGKLKERDGGLGTYLLRSMTRQLKGQINTENDNGAVYTIYFMEKIRS